MVHHVSRSLPPKPQSWDDVFKITGGLHGVPIKEIEAGLLLWEYELSPKDRRHCGREGCKQIHAHGWLVDLNGGRFVHVGKDCANKYANRETWQAKVGDYYERIRRAAQDRAFCEAREQAQSIIHWLDNNTQLKVCTRLYDSILAELPAALLDDLRKRAERRDADVIREHKLSEAEISSRRQAQTIIRDDGSTQVPYVSHVETVLIGRLRGLSCFRNEIARLKRSIEDDAMILLCRSHDEMARKERDEMLRRITDTRNNKRALDKSVSDLLLFVQSENLNLLAGTEIARRQGVVGITAQDEALVVTRRLGWGEQAA